MMEKMNLPLDLKGAAERRIEGLGAVFGNRDHGGDIIVPGAFTKTLRDPPNTIRPMLWQHNPDRVAGRWDTLAENDEGLVVKGTLADTELGNELYTLVKMGAVGAMSIGYQTVDYSYDKKGNRLLKELMLHEVSLVSMPMNPLAQIQFVKSRMSANGEYVPTAREFESALRDVGCSKSVARRLVAMCRDLDDDGETPLPSRVVPVETDAAEALKALADQMLADAILTKFR
jgi:hypothetical protein